MKRLHTTIRLPLALAVTFTLAGCAAGAPPPTEPAPGEPGPEARGVPGFDTRGYPGDATMRLWRDESPYRWVGFYLTAPCYTGTSWQGKRETLRDMGWGLAVLFVGEQDWPLSSEATPEEAVPDAARRTGGDRCTRDNLSAARGRVDGQAAADAAAAEGFATGTIVYLDVEPVETVSDSLTAYVAAWTDGLLRRGYRPGLYAHARNAETLLAVMRRAGGDAVEPRLWVASTGGFSLRRGPTESGFPATIWQGVLDMEETWGGTTLRIDQNVADRADPSG